MLTSLIPSEQIYTVQIAHPKGNTGLVSVRALPVVAPNDRRGTLRNKQFFKATLIERENGEVWAKIVECLSDPSVEGYYCALRYGGKTFAAWRELVEHPIERPPLYLILPDWYLPDGFPRNPKNAPQVHYLGHYSKLTKPWQEFWWNLNRPVGFTDAQTKLAFKKYTGNKAFITDYKGSEQNADYINRTNLQAGPMEIKSLFCGLNVVTGTDDGEWLYPAALNATESPPVGTSYETHPWYIHHANIISNDLPDGTRRVNPFLNFGGRDTGIGVLYPFMKMPNKFIRYPTAWVRRLEADEPIPSPYWPEMI